MSVAEMETPCADIPWPTRGGVWMAWIEEMEIYFPLLAIPLRDDAPTGKELDYYEPRRKVMSQLRPVLAITVNFPRGEGDYPFTFQACHPCNRFREPTPDELKKARHFWRIET